ncbi:MAG: M20/M25/M40 family metallo-hydrolase [Parvularculaceae bacterium]|nr:M20/M25/M40 family metallo-hydrolase [Parvularculaceae bacterium]
MVKKLTLTILAIIAVIAGVVLARTLAISTASPATPLTPRAFPGDGEAIAERLATAIRIETVSWGDDRPADDAAFQEFREFLAAAYPAAHAVMQREIINRNTLIYRWPGEDAAEKPIALIAHIDVVPIEPGTEDQWTRPAFSGDAFDGAVWGRGSLDNKGQLIAIMEAVERLAAAGFTPRRDIYLLFGHDEEQGGADGAAEIRKYLDRNGIYFDWTLDEGSGVVDGLIDGLKTPIALIAIAEKGAATLKISATAPGGHSSTPGPETAVSLVARAVADLTDNPYPLEINAAMTDFLHAMAPQFPFVQRMALANLWLSRPLIAKSLGASPATAAALRTTTAATMIDGGVKANILPQTAHAYVNYRIHPRDSVAGVKARAIRQINDDRITVEVLGGAEPSPQAATDSDGYRAIAAASREVFDHPGMPVAPFLTLQGTDTRHYVGAADNNYRFTPFLYEADDLKRIHGTDERIEVVNLVRAVAWYEALLNEAAGEARPNR